MKKAKLKVCSKCKYIMDQKTEKCPICGSTNFANKWRGEIIILNLSSELARALNITKEGVYAIQVS